MLAQSTWSYSRCKITNRRSKKTISWSRVCLRSNTISHSKYLTAEQTFPFNSRLLKSLLIRICKLLPLSNSKKLIIRLIINIWVSHREASQWCLFIHRPLISTTRSPTRCNSYPKAKSNRINFSSNQVSNQQALSSKWCTMEYSRSQQIS